MGHTSQIKEVFEYIDKNILWKNAAKTWGVKNLIYTYILYFFMSINNLEQSKVNISDVPKSKIMKYLLYQETKNVGARIKYDVKSQSPFYNYVNKQKQAHVVWFEDASNMTAKFKLVSEYGLREVSYWSLGKAFPQNWYLLSNMFEITKLVK